MFWMFYKRLKFQSPDKLWGIFHKYISHRIMPSLNYSILQLHRVLYRVYVFACALIYYFLTRFCNVFVLLAKTILCFEADHSIHNLDEVLRKHLHNYQYAF